MTSLSRVLLFAVVAVVPANTWAAPSPQIFFGEDLPQFDDETLLLHPISDAARAQFLSNLSSFVTENFESFPPNSPATLALNFGAFGSATLQDVAVPPGTPGKITQGVAPGRPLSDIGNEVLGIALCVLHYVFPATGSVRILRCRYRRLRRPTHHYVCRRNFADAHCPEHALTDGLGGSVLYFGFIDIANPFMNVSFDNTSVGTGIFDIFAFDDLTIGTAQQIVVAGVPTLTEWGMAFMALFLAVSAVFYIRRQQRSEVRLG